MKPFPINRILASTDLTDASLPALRYARLFANEFAAKLTVMYADPLIHAGDFVPPAGAMFGRLSQEPLGRLRGEVAQHADGVMAGRPYDIEVTAGDPVPAILETATERKADLIIVGTHLRHGWRSTFIGSVSNGVLHGSRCPVLTVASRDSVLGPRPTAIRNILCPVNFTEVAAGALNVAAGMARAFGAQLTIVHVAEREDRIVFARDEERVRRWIDPELQHSCSFRELVVRGDPAERMLDCADNLGAELLVVGAQHTSFRDATIAGTTTERLIRLASCPVLVVPREAVRKPAFAPKEAGAHEVAPSVKEEPMRIRGVV